MFLCFKYRLGREAESHRGHCLPIMRLIGPPGRRGHRVFLCLWRSLGCELRTHRGHGLHLFSAWFDRRGAEDAEFTCLSRILCDAMWAITKDIVLARSWLIFTAEAARTYSACFLSLPGVFCISAV